MPAAQARVLPLNGASNCRDLGGYRGRDGRLVRWRRLLRSDHLAGLSDADRSTLRELGLAVTMRADGRRAVGIAHRRGGARVSEPDGCTLWIDGWWRACCDVHDMAFISGSVDLDTHLERAARFLYLQRLAFGGKIVGRSFGVDRCGPGRFDVRKLGPMLEGIHERMAGVVIENLDFEAFIRRYDRHGALFFLDPPYWGNEGDYGKDLFARADFERLTRCLRDIKGRFILTINDRPETRSLFAGMAIDAVGVTYSVGDRNDHQAREIIVSTPG